MKPRHHLYLDEALTRELDMLASKRGTTNSAIVADVLRDYLRRRATRKLNDMLKVRLDRISNELSKQRRDTDILLESLALFVRYQLTGVQSLDGRRRAMLRTAMGPAIAGALADPLSIEVMVNPDGALRVERLGEGRIDSGIRLEPGAVERINTPPELFIALGEYAAQYEASYGKAEPLAELAVAMLAHFLEIDREFARSRKGR